MSMCDRAAPFRLPVLGDTGAPSREAQRKPATSAFRSGAGSGEGTKAAKEYDRSLVSLRAAEILCEHWQCPKSCADGNDRDRFAWHVRHPEFENGAIVDLEGSSTVAP